MLNRSLAHVATYISRKSTFGVVVVDSAYAPARLVVRNETANAALWLGLDGPMRRAAQLGQGANSRSHLGGSLP
eukprot:9635198-Lingulodinium_polyedra.AAC.1